MPNWRSMQDKDYLGAWDLVGKDGKPKDFTLEITAVAAGLLKTRENPKGKRKVVITLRGAEKRFVSNSTNCETIESLYGAETENWVGKRVTLYQTLTRNPKGGGQIACIRVRPQAPRGAAETIDAQPVDAAMRSAQDAAFDRGGNPDDY